MGSPTMTQFKMDDPRVCSSRSGCCRRLRRRRGSSAGFTVLEIAVAISLLTIAIGSVTMTLVATGSLTRTTGERATAMDGALSAMEALKAETFADLFVSYNGFADDDPGFAGSAPGAAFDVAGLQPQDGDADGRVGLILFPGDGVELREDTVDTRLGMPRDLSGDGIIDAADHAGDYTILPVRVRVEWSGKSGDQTIEFISTLTEL